MNGMCAWSISELDDGWYMVSVFGVNESGPWHGYLEGSDSLELVAWAYERLVAHVKQESSK